MKKYICDICNNDTKPWWKEFPHGITAQDKINSGLLIFFNVNATNLSSVVEKNTKFPDDLNPASIYFIGEDDQVVPHDTPNPSEESMVLNPRRKCADKKVFHVCVKCTIRHCIKALENIEKEPATR